MLKEKCKMKKSNDCTLRRKSQNSVASSSPHFHPCSIARNDLNSCKIAHAEEMPSKKLMVGKSNGLGKSVLSFRDWYAISFGLLKDQMIKRRTAEKQILEGNRKLASVYEGICRAMNAILATKDPYTALHQERVAKLATAITRELDLTGDEVEGIRFASLLHDIGKIAIPAEILSKSGELSSHEFGLIHEHPQIGYSILSAIEFPWDIGKIILQHHERLDGSGYPFGARNNEIVFGARILAVADVVEAVSFHRPYREALGIADALHLIQEHKNVLFDQAAVEACLHVFYESKFSF
jgi:putative nucleotidyltransferase with HDIG domain